jgi:hypothetical protein
LAHTDVFTGEEDLNPTKKLILFTMALIQNKHMFVELLLETGFDLKSFLTKKALYYLYNCKEVIICDLIKTFYLFLIIFIKI